MSETLRLIKGDTGNWEFTCVDGDGEPMDLAGAEAEFALRDDDGEVLSKTIADGLEAGDGTLALTLVPADTVTLRARTYHWGLKVTYSAEEAFTIGEGLFILNPVAVS